MTPSQLTAQTEAVLDFLGGLAMPTQAKELTAQCPACGGTGVLTDENGVMIDDACPECWGDGKVEL